MQLSYVENSTYFLEMDSSLDGNMYMVLYKKIDENNGLKNGLRNRRNKK